MMKKVCYIVFYAFNSGNEISKVEGLDGLYQLKELVLDKNKIKVQIEFGSVLHVTVWVSWIIFPSYSTLGRKRQSKMLLTFKIFRILRRLIKEASSNHRLHLKQCRSINAVNRVLANFKLGKCRWLKRQNILISYFLFCVGKHCRGNYCYQIWKRYDCGKIRLEIKSSVGNLAEFHLMY